MYGLTSFLIGKSKLSPPEYRILSGIEEVTMLRSLRLKGLDRVELFSYEMALSKPNTSVHPLRQFFL